ncbi:MAG TPA: serine acetyltransferase [Methylomirabilota bacterium]|jgi:serine O-acetyltransferase|nr:serine acetyltransferase [Methylomirabilota bacterium]
MFDNVRADLRHAREINGLPPGVFSLWVKTPLHLGSIAVLTYRLSSWARRVRVPVLRQVLLVLTAIERRFVELVTGVWISPRAEIGPGLVVHTIYGVFISETHIGRNCVVQHGVAITHGVRSIGDDVYFGPGAKVIGRAAIGNNVRVVANSVVMTDVADNLTVVGVPARIKWRNPALRPAAAAAQPPDGSQPKPTERESDLISPLPLL